MAGPQRGEVWLVDLSPIKGHEQGGRRPCLIISVDFFNTSAAGLVIVIPITTRNRRIRSHVPIVPPEGGVKECSFAKCEDVRSISVERLMERWGVVGPDSLAEIEDRLRILMGL